MSRELREQIADVIHNHIEEAISDLEYHRAADATDRIIALVREAMLDTNVAETSVEGLPKLYDSNRIEIFYPNMAWRVIHAALSTAFGPASDHAD